MKQASKQQKPRRVTEDGDGPSPAKPTAETFDTAYFIAEATLGEPSEPTRPPSPPAEIPLSPATVPPSPPLAPIAALWPSPASSPDKVTAATQAPKPPAAPKVKVTFVLPIGDAKRVSLSGEFNGWSPDATPMKRHADGHWEATVDLAPGRYEYKFVRDGEWIPDLLACENVWNQQGTLNSVVEVRA
jgi:hypothetical protein